MRLNKKLTPEEIWGACEHTLNHEAKRVDILNYENNTCERWFVKFILIPVEKGEGFNVNFVSNIPTDTEGLRDYLILRSDFLCDHFAELAELAWQKGDHELETRRRYKSEAMLTFTRQLELHSYGIT